MPQPRTIIKYQFPQVKKIVDATETIAITVTKKDTLTGRKKDPEQCALARACIRTKIADAAIIGIGYSYLIKGDTATRYKTSAGVAREITSYDRHNDFAEGVDYKLSKVNPAARLGGHKSESGPHKEKSKNLFIVHKHHTSDIRLLKEVK